jgi:hypothetical protein
MRETVGLGLVFGFILLAFSLTLTNCSCFSHLPLHKIAGGMSNFPLTRVPSQT